MAGEVPLAVDINEALRLVILHVGDDPTREGLRDTPSRIIKAYAEMFSGYGKSAKDVLKTFDADGYDEMIILKEIELYSCCEHHMLPFIGKAHVGYIPDGRIVGLSKLARVVEIFSRRLQVQERLTVQVTQALDEHLKPLGSACVIEAQHQCIACRGIQKQHSVMVTSSLTGEMRKPEVRSEFLRLIGK